MANKIIKCKICGADIASNAKTCPQCGAKNKKPIYKKWWFYALIVIVLFAIIGSSQRGEPSSSANGSAAASAGAKSNSTPEPITYIHYDVKELFDALKANALKAQETYNGQYVELEGYLGTIDSDGKYIGLTVEDGNYDYLFQEVQCYIKTDEQKKIIMDMSHGDHLVIRGKIISVGELLGYSLSIDSIG